MSIEISEEEKVDGKCPKTPCPICGKLITSHPAGRGKHMKLHEYLEPETAGLEVDSKYKPKDEEDRMLYEMAIRAQERLKNAPDALIYDNAKDERRRLVEIYAPQAIDPPYDPASGKPRQFADFTPYFGRHEERAKDCNNGYIPVFNEHREHVQDQGSYLYIIPSKQSLAKKKREAQESKERLKSPAANSAELREDIKEHIEYSEEASV